jgi:hypothetical protein
MAVRKLVLSVFFFFCVLGLIFAQEAYDMPEDNKDNRGDGLVVSLDMAVDAFNLTTQTFEHPEIRGPKAQDNTEFNLLISNWEFAKDANASIGYNARYFGGNFAFEPKIVEGSWTFGAKISGWAQFSFLRFVLGNNIETLYADRQGSDEALAVYTFGKVNGDWVDPDNITDSTGLLVRAFVNDWTFDAAAGDFSYKWLPTGRQNNGSANENTYADRFNIDFRYGARVGYKLKDLGKINASYKIYQKTTADKYDVKGGNSLEIEPFNADARYFDHQYGLYGSFNLKASNFTAGYVGAATAYLPEFWITTEGGKMVETGVPVVLRHGAVLNALWEGNPWTFRTDNGVTFWQDKNYNIFGMTSWDYNQERKEVSDIYSFINHFVMRNGFGANYKVTNSLSAGVYLNNTFFLYSVSGNTPGAVSKKEYALWEDQARLEFSLSYSFNPNASAYVSLKFNDSIVSRSKDLNEQTRNTMFVDKYHNEKPEPIATLDNTFSVNIPIGISLRIR